MSHRRAKWARKVARTLTDSRPARLYSACVARCGGDPDAPEVVALYQKLTRHFAKMSPQEQEVVLAQMESTLPYFAPGSGPAKISASDAFTTV